MGPSRSRLTHQIRFPAPFRRWGRSVSGVTAIEFALISPVFFVLLVGILEVGLMYLAQVDLQNAINNASRTIRTGQVQAQNLSSSAFRTQICSKVSALMNCGAKLQVDVQSFATFANGSYSTPLNADGTLNQSLTNFTPGGASKIVLVRALYPWPVSTPLLTPFLVNMAGNSHLIVATAAFRNEPY